jgi:hypothetical protein
MDRMRQSAPIAISCSRPTTTHRPNSLRVYADFVVAARRDMGLSATELTAVEILGMRLTDLYTSAKFYDIAHQPFEELCAQYGWQPPWLIKREDMQAPEQLENESASGDNQLHVAATPDGAPEVPPNGPEQPSTTSDR